jgi:alcohol dehydrogenase (cytochrome c)
VPSSSLLATAGGLLFAGHTDRTFQALDEDTGKVLWQTRLASAPNATPVTFSVDGRQYVAIASGAGGDQATQTEQVTPEQVPSAPATTIFVFGL